MDYKFEEFKNKLCKEFGEYPKLVTEDLIRHWFICENGKESVKIECPYFGLPLKVCDTKKPLFKNQQSRARADLYYSDSDSVFEFKYHKKVENSASCITNNFGYVFGDLNRLSTLCNKHRYMVYVFDLQMYEYYRNHCNELLLENGKFSFQTVFDRSKNIVSFVDPAFSTFNDTSKKEFNYKVEIAYSADLGRQYYLRIYRVLDE